MPTDAPAVPSADLVNCGGLVLGRLLRRFQHPGPHSPISNFLVAARKR